MAREVAWADTAWDDLEAAAEYIARDSEYYAAAFVYRLQAHQVTILAVIHGAR
jgi:plasmid stabilization system protein ParE